MSNSRRLSTKSTVKSSLDSELTIGSFVIFSHKKRDTLSIFNEEEERMIGFKNWMPHKTCWHNSDGCNIFLIGIISLFIGVLLCFSISLVNMAEIGSNQQRFTNNLFKTLAADATEKNVIFSPVSIQSCFALAFLGAKGETAEELRNGLMLGSGDRNSIAQNYGSFLTKSFANQNENGPQLKLANRIYVNSGLELKADIRELAESHFKAGIEPVQFAKASEAVDKINNWVEQSTNGQIQNLMPKGAVDSATSSVLVNAIYFKGKWAKQFSMDSTSKSTFSVNPTKTVSVDMMYADEKFNYAEIPELDAQVIELPYANSDMSMLVILPNKIHALRQVEQKLANYDFKMIVSKLRKHDVDLFLPKFKIEFETDLKTPLQQMGISKIFSTESDLSGLFAGSQPQKISQARHKAFLDVNEAGTEAAAATFLKISPMSLNFNTKTFRADHPFVFAIRNNDAVFYAGHVVNI